MPQEALREIYNPQDSDKAIDTALEKLRAVLIGSKGFALVCVINQGGAACMQVAGGQVAVEHLAQLAIESLQFSTTLSRQKDFPVENGPCNCPSCRAKQSQKVH